MGDSKSDIMMMHIGALELREKFDCSCGFKADLYSEYDARVCLIHIKNCPPSKS